MFESWLVANNRTLDVDLKKLVQSVSLLFQKSGEANQSEICSAVDKLASALGDDKVQYKVS